MVDIVLGGFYGDEGKGKVIDYLAKEADIIVRATGGSNTGNTVVLNEKRCILRTIPVAILNPNVVTVIGNGVIIDPKILVNEMNLLKSNGVNLENLKISEKAHIIMPYHIKLDALEEERRGNDKIGTTLSGVGPANSDKVERYGIRVQDFISSRFSKMLKRNIEMKNKIFESYENETIDYNSILEEYSNDIPWNVEEGLISSIK